MADLKIFKRNEFELNGTVTTMPIFTKNATIGFLIRRANCLS